MKNIVLLLSLLASLMASAKPSIDSLTLILARHSVADSGRVDLLNQLGYEYWIITPVQSELFGQEALKLASKLRYARGIAFAKRIIGVSYWTQGQFPTALKYLMEGLVTYQQINDHMGVGSMLNNIGLVYHDQRTYGLAQQYFEQALEKYRQSGNQVEQAGVLSNLGITYFGMGNYIKAEQFCNQALQLNKTSGRSYGVAESYSNLGELALARKDLSGALRYLVESIRIRSTIHDQEGLAMCYSIMGKVYLARQMFDLSEKYLHQGIEAALRVHSLKWLTAGYETLKNLEVARKNYPRAIAYFEEYSARKDSLFNTEKSRQIAQQQRQFEILQKEQQLQLQQKKLRILRDEARLQGLLRNGLLAGVTALVIMAYLVVSRQRLKIRKNKVFLLKTQEVFQSQQALAKFELENARLQETKLMQELELKNKKLTSYSVNFIQKNELMEELKSNLDQLKKGQVRDTVRQLGGFNRLVEHSAQIDREWEEFKLHFEEVHKDFYKLLKDCYPDLTNHELKLCTLLKLNMNLKEAANTMGISPESVKKARHRLRKKFGLGRDENLIDHIIGLENHLKNIPAEVA